jgi:hypothetical protein
MVSQHRKRRFPESLLASTFAISSWGNGAMGFSAGLLGQVCGSGLGSQLMWCT